MMRDFCLQRQTQARPAYAATKKSSLRRRIMKSALFDEGKKNKPP
jgi:hypothetical protein